jgi:hypothetical protein
LTAPPSAPALEGLRRAFEAEAQVLRAHLAALAEEPASGGDDHEALARDLASLTGTAEPGREA